MLVWSDLCDDGKHPGKVVQGTKWEICPECYTGEDILHIYTLKAFCLLLAEWLSMLLMQHLLQNPQGCFSFFVKMPQQQ